MKIQRLNQLHSFAMLVAFVGIPLSAMAETRLHSAYCSYKVQPLFNPSLPKRKSIGYPIRAKDKGALGGSTSEASIRVSSGLIEDGFFLDGRLDTIQFFDRFHYVQTYVEVQYIWNIEVVGQNESVTMDPWVLDYNCPPYSWSFSGSITDSNGQPVIWANLFSILLPPGRYEMIVTHNLYDNTYQSNTFHSSVTTAVHFTNLTIVPGATQNNPVLPGPGGSFLGGFFGWYDPPMAQGYIFTATGTAVFKEIMAFPSGIPGDFYVNTEGASYGPFTNGDSVDFQALRGHGVSSFVVKGIKPFVDATSPVAFPIMLDFTEATADFTMVPIAAPDLQMETLPNGDLKFTFDGVLQSSLDLTNWTDVTPAPTSPYVIPKAQGSGMKFFRSRDP